MKKFIKTILPLIIVLSLAVAGFSMFYSETVNFLIIGIEGTRTDTIIYVSVNTKNNTVDAISIPRDTYFPTEGHSKAGQKKINAVYGFKDVGGAEGVKNAVSKLLGTNIDYYVKVDYDGVRKIVDMIGGVEVDIPYEMKYDDPYADPPLHIYFEPGVQTINGDQAMEYLRFRKSKSGKYSGGDVQRVERQQQFLKNAASKSLSPKLPILVSSGLKYIETDAPKWELSKISTAMLGTQNDNIRFHILPEDRVGKGSDGLSYFFHSEEKTSQLMTLIRNNDFPKLEEENEDASN